MKRSLLLLGLVTALYFPGSLPASATVYRCESNGETVYSDHPCGKQAKQIKLAPAPTITLAPVPQQTSQASHAARHAKSRHARVCRYDQLSSIEQRNLRVSHLIMICEPADAVRAAWGKPDKVTRKHTRGHVREHWIYHDLNGHKSGEVSLDNGRVTAFHGHAVGNG